MTKIIEIYSLIFSGDYNLICCNNYNLIGEGNSVDSSKNGMISIMTNYFHHFVKNNLPFPEPKQKLNGNIEEIVRYFSKEIAISDQGIAYVGQEIVKPETHWPSLLFIFYKVNTVHLISKPLNIN